MPVTVVVGGQFGSEGKGKVAHYLAKEMNASVAIRCGGPNSGHTVIDSDGNPIIFQQLPTASILPNIKIVLCAGMYIDLDILFREIEMTGLTNDRLFIDPNAIIITPEIKRIERNYGLIDSIGSTGSGTGEAVIRRIQRYKKILFARDESTLSIFIKDTKNYLRNFLSRGSRVILEGTQGYGLSVLHSPFYPYVTSRDTTAAGFISEAGLSPIDVDNVVLTIRAFPIRVAGNSGPLPYEVSWEEISSEASFEKCIVEKSSVTKQVRRVARFDPYIVREAIKSNNPNSVIMNHVDYLSKEIEKSNKVSSFVAEIEKTISCRIDYLGFGPDKIIKRLH